MRWDSLRLDDARADTPCASVAQPMFGRDAVARTFDTPGFRGAEFYEIHARSIISRVPGGSRMPFRWTINPYRGCGHACVYCFARNSHTYLDLDAGLDFNTKIVVKVNAPDLAVRELAGPRWHGEHIAMGTNVDCYQRAEGRYRLMPGIIAALRDAANPFSILTKGTLLLRDADLLAQAAEVTSVGLAVSVGFADAALSRLVEPGTPTPQRRLQMCAALRGRGLDCAVLMGPVLPFLTDSPSQLAATVRQIAEAGATSVSPIVLHLRPGAREWFWQWLEDRFPGLTGRYRALYGHGSYAPREYQARIAGQVAELARRYRVGARSVAGGGRRRDTAQPGHREPGHREPGHPGPDPARAARQQAGQPGLDLFRTARQEPGQPADAAALATPGRGQVSLRWTWRDGPAASAGAIGGTLGRAGALAPAERDQVAGQRDGPVLARGEQLTLL